MDLYGFTPGILEIRPLRPILQKMHPLSAASLPAGRQVCLERVAPARDEWAVKKGLSLKEYLFS